jgi:putative endonuclease
MQPNAHPDLRKRSRRERGPLSRHEIGARAELAVADFLFARGFVVLARNVRLGSLELDVVARRGDLVVVVEARTRGPGSMTRALESVSHSKRVRLRRAVARLWRESLRRMPGVDRVRIDVAAVTFTGRGASIEYVAGALGPYG